MSQKGFYSKNKQLKIAFLGNQISWGGAAKSLLLLIKSISNDKHKLYLYVTKCSSPEMKNLFEQYVEFVKVVDLPEIVSAQTESVKNNIKKININKVNLTNVEKLAKELNQLEIDILHINNSVFSPIYGIIRSLTKVKIVSHIREWIHWNGIHQKQIFIIDSIMYNSDAIICISDTEAEVFKQHSNLHVIPNPFDFDEVDHIKKNNKAALDLFSNTFVIGMMGSFQRNKGAINFIKAIAYLKKYKVDFGRMKFVVLGGEINKNTNKCKHLLRKMLGKETFNYDLYNLLKITNLNNEVVFLNKRANVFEIINLFDVAVRPSYTGDPWGRDIIEYMALKKAVVATGSSEFFIKNGDTGFIVPPSNYIEMAEKIYWLYNTNNERIEMGQRAFGSIFEKCNMDVFRKNLLLVYNTLIKA